MSLSEPRPILVGLSGSERSWAALEWACVRACAGGVPLRIVHAFHWPRAADPYGIQCWLHTSPYTAAQDVLDAAVERARERSPGLQVTGRVLVTHPVAALRREGRRAELIVVGGTRRQGWRTALSVHARVARRNRGRVVIVDWDDEVLI